MVFVRRHIRESRTFSRQDILVVFIGSSHDSCKCIHESMLLTCSFYFVFFQIQYFVYILFMFSRASQSYMVNSWRDRKRRADEISENQTVPLQFTEETIVSDAEHGAAAVLEHGEVEGDSVNVNDQGVSDVLVDDDADDRPPADELPICDLQSEEEEDGDEVEEALQCVAPKTFSALERLTLEEYRAKWETALEVHSRCNTDPFSASNLCPRPLHQLWQDCVSLSFCLPLYLGKCVCGAMRIYLYTYIYIIMSVLFNQC